MAKQSTPAGQTPPAELQIAQMTVPSSVLRSRTTLEVSFQTKIPATTTPILNHIE